MGQAHLATAFLAQPAEPFGLRLKQGRSSPPLAPASCRQNPAGRPAVDRRRWNGRGASWRGDGPVLRPERGEELIGRLLCV
jgi:hypothetical protein